MTTLNLNDPYLERIINHFSAFKHKPFTAENLLPYATEFEVATSLDYEISSEDHIAFIEAVQKLAETLISCTLGVFEARQEGNRIATVGLIKMLSQLFFIGHQASENRLKYKWTKDGTKEIEEKIEVYKDLSNAILYGQQKQQQLQPLQIEEDVGNLMAHIQPFIDIKQEDPRNIKIRNYEEMSPLPPGKEPKILSTSGGRNFKNNLNSVTEGCQNDLAEETEIPVFLSLLTAPPPPPPVIQFLPPMCLTYPTDVKVGYSHGGKKPILIVSDPILKDNVYTYRNMIKGSYRCTSCGLLNVHRYAKLFQGVLYANLHECHGKPRKTVENEQLSRAELNNYAPLPSLLELSTSEDPRPYPPYPKKRPVTRSQNPNNWEDLVEYTNFSSCITNRPGMVGYVAYDNYNPTLCYEYAPSSRGSYRCVSCIRFRRHTIAKVDDFRRVLQSAAHVCIGITIDEFEASQAQRRHFNSQKNIIEINDFEL